MKSALVIASVLAVGIASPAFAQSAAYPTPDNNLTRSDDVDPSEAPYLNDEVGRPSGYSIPPADDGVIVDYGEEGASSGESGDDSAELPPPDALPPPD